MARFVTVDIKHPSGVVEYSHKVELAAHSRRTAAEQVEDHLRHKYANGIRGGWTYQNLKDASVAPVVKAKAAPVAPVVAPVEEPKGA